MLRRVKTRIKQGYYSAVELLIRKVLKLHPSLLLSLNSFALPKGLQGEPFTYQKDGLATIHNSDFVKEPRFARAYQRGKDTGSWYDWDLEWRIYVLVWCAEWAARLPGDFVECGVNRGGFARSILDYIPFDGSSRSYFLFDTFKGLDDAFLTADEKATVAKSYVYDECYESVKREFASFPFVKIIRGSVPDTLSFMAIGQVAFLSIDMNCVLPEIAAAEFFWPRMAPGGVIVLDDYGFSLHSQQKAAFDALVKEWKVSILSLPTGQGLIFKPTTAAC
jgi:O-methyltransferase